MGKRFHLSFFRDIIKNIAAWYREQSILRTAKNRPDLLEKAELTEKERQWLIQQLEGEERHHE